MRRRSLKLAIPFGLYQDRISRSRNQREKRSPKKSPKKNLREKSEEKSEESFPAPAKFNFNLWILLKLFVVILCLKSWWILATWGTSFFFKDWPYLGVFQIQPYLIPNLLGVWYLAWKGRRILVRKIGDASSLGESTEHHDLLMKFLAILYFQCPVSIFFAITGLNPVFSQYFGVIAAVLLNVMLGVGLRYLLPRKFPNLDPD